ncbi:Protein of unknown function [Propionibacterium freudenreichii]|nr:Protein of unknown function [Propionibacterium freudenreichii]
MRLTTAAIGPTDMRSSESS